MPVVPFEALPDHARVWVFASARPLQGDDAALLLDEVDAFLDQWHAHGSPLRCSREWRDDHFLAIGVDPTAEQASGCSIDGMFRRLQDLERRLSTGLIAGGRVFYRAANGKPRQVLRTDVSKLTATGELTAESTVFDTSVTDAGAWRDRFVRPARETWVWSLLSGSQASQASSPSATNASSVRNG